jgi:hypothetical protein
MVVEIRCLVVAFATMGLLTGARHACAVSIYGRDTASGDWISGWIDQNGITGGVPTAADDAYIGSGGYPWPSAQAVATVNLTDIRQANSVTLGYATGDSGTLNIQPAASLGATDFYLADAGTGILNITGGSLSVSNLYVSRSGGSATMNLNGQTVSVDNKYEQWGPVTINRGAGGGLDGSSYAIHGGSFDFQGADSFSNKGAVDGGATVANSVPQYLGSTLEISDTGTSYSANDYLRVGTRVTVSGGATLNLNASELSTSFLELYGAGAVNQNGGAYGTSFLYLDDGASLEYQPNDVIEGSVVLKNGATFSLGQDLEFGNNLSVIDSTLNLNGYQAFLNGGFSLSGSGVLNRGANGGIWAPSFSINGATFELAFWDSFDSGSVLGGATVWNNVAKFLDNGLDVSGAGTTYTANANLYIGYRLTVRNGAQFNANAAINVAADITVQNAVLNSAANVTAHGGLYVSSNGTVNAAPGMTVHDFLSIGAPTGDASLLVLTQSPGNTTGLSLVGESSILDIGAEGTLGLVFDSQDTPGEFDWAFRWQGDHVDELVNLLGTRIVVSGAPQPVGVIRDDAYGDFTFVGYVPILRGDDNDDGTVDAADYVAWRKLNGGNSQGYDDWRENFAESSNEAASFDSSSLQANVPEPSALVLALATIGWLSPRRQGRA